MNICPIPHRWGPSWS